MPRQRVSSKPLNPPARPPHGLNTGTKEKGQPHGRQERGSHATRRQVRKLRPEPNLQSKSPVDNKRDWQPERRHAP